MVAQTFAHALAPQDQPKPFRLALDEYWLMRARSMHPLRAQGRFNRPMPGVAETQCFHCGALILGPRTGWIPASYNQRGQLRPVALGVPFSLTPCDECAAPLRRLARLGARFSVVPCDDEASPYKTRPNQYSRDYSALPYVWKRQKSTEGRSHVQ